MSEPVDDLGIPLKRTRGRPINPEKFQGTYRVKAYKRKRGSWPERIENMRAGDAASNTERYEAEDYTAQKARAWFEREGHAIRKALMRVRKETPEVRLRTFEVTRHETNGTAFSRILTITLSRLT